MTRHMPLDNVTHKRLRVNTVYALGRGFDYNLARAYPAELVHLQREYALFFTKNPESGHFEPMALLGFGQNENLYLADGRWDAEHVPISVQRQPFLIGLEERMVDGVPAQVPVAHVDMDHPSVSETDGIPVFLPQGGESPYLERMNSILGAIYTGHEQARQLSQVLVGLELIESVTLNVEFEDGSRMSLEGLFSVNEEKFRQLDASVLGKLHQGGHLQSVFMMFASLLNVGRLIARKNRHLAISRAAV